jgi:hypothetical protein
MEDFNDRVWERYGQTQVRLRRLEKRYMVLATTLVILTATYAHLFYQYFKNAAY